MFVDERRTDKEIREWVKVHLGHLSKAQQRKIRGNLEYVRDFYEADGITPISAGLQASAKG